MIRDTKVQSFQYKIVHRFFPCNYTLNKWYPNKSKNCMKCNEIDSLEHYFYLCPELQYFWSSFFKWWYNINQLKVNVHSLEIVLGIQNQNRDPNLDCLNYCIIYAKEYISEYKYNDKDCIFYEFQRKMKNILDSEFVSYQIRGLSDKFHNLLGTLYQNM